MRILRHVLVLGAVSWIAPALAAPPEPPNILFVFADDQRPDTISATGNPVIQTPNLDRLVRDGFHFSNAYCMGSMGGAVCVPSRSMLHVGRTLFRAPNDMGQLTTLGQRLRAEGYSTFGTGKWHNGRPSLLRSFEQGRAVFFGGMCDHTKVPLVDTTPDGLVVNERIGEGFSNTLFADAAIAFLEGHDGDRPFFAYVAFTAPHDPRQAPEGYIDMYDPDSVPLPPNFQGQHPFDNGWLILRDENLAPWPRTERVIRHQIAEYYGLITHMDQEIGRILEALERTGQAENTIIIYAADHGLAMGSHGLLGKQSLYEHSMKAPLIVAGPGVPKGESSDALVYLLDLYPTICDLAGISPPEDVEGQSLTPVWRGDSPTSRASLYTAMGQTIRAVRDDRFKLIRYPQVDQTQLFDLKNDPHERDDLSDDPDHARKVEELTARLTNWQAQVGDKWPLSVDDPKPAEIDLTGHPRKPDPHQPDWIVRKYFQMEGWDEN
ncbi:sulfatase-like hydrolase/transferase [soil metagenome]